MSYAFGARLEGGTDPGMPNPAPTSSVINRSPDPAVMDNAYALSGPREVASLMLSFEDGDNLASVWSASISQVVENQNQPDLDKVRRKLEPASRERCGCYPTPLPAKPVDLGIRAKGQGLTRHPSPQILKRSGHHGHSRRERGTPHMRQ